VADGRISVRARSLRVAALAAVLAPIGLVMSVANDSPVQAPEPVVQTPGVVWAGRVFVDQEAAAWLRARGVSYEIWAARHPVAAAQLDAR
jgi:hypothetical protein